MAEGLVAWWPSTAIPGSRIVPEMVNGYHGRWLGNDVTLHATSPWGHRGMFMDHADDIVEIVGTNKVGHPLSLPGEFTMFCWHRRDFNQGILIGKRDGASDQWQWQYDSTPECNFRYGGSNEASSGSTCYPTSDEWDIMAVAGDMADTSRITDFYKRDPRTMEFFTDNSSGTHSSVTEQASVRVSLGARWNTYPTSAFETGGYMADVRIYNRLHSAEWVERAMHRSMWFDLWWQPKRTYLVPAVGGLGIPIAAYHYNHHIGSMQS